MSISYTTAQPHNKRVANVRDNFVGLVKSANASKGAKSFRQWTRHQGLGLDVDKVFTTRMKVVEKMARKQLQAKIDELLAAKGAL